MSQKTKEYRKQLAEMFARILEEKSLDWKKEWKGIRAIPINAKQNYKYKGINRFRLSLIAHMEGYTDPRWATYKQIQDMGYKLQGAKGKGVKVEYWFPYDVFEGKVITWEEFHNLTEGRPNSRYQLRASYSTVFNAKYIEGLPSIKEVEKRETIVSHVVNTLSKNMGVEIIHDGGDRAFYRPSEDKIHLPNPDVFFSDYAYNATALHELAHSTGHVSRLNRNLKGGHGSEDYANEELIAEITSCFMSAELDIPQMEEDLNNHKAYVQSWISAIRERPELLVKAIAEAEKATAYMEYKAELIPEIEYKEILESTMVVNERSNEPKLLEQMEATSESQYFDKEVHLKIPPKNSREVFDASQYSINRRLFLDLDGTVAEFKPVDTLETLYEKGYFLNLAPIQNVVDAVNIIIKKHPEIEVYVMSSVLEGSKYAIQEKNQWIDKYLPGIANEHRIFPPCGENKLDYIPEGVRETDFLMDDYTYNLTLWEPPAKAIKLLNGINHTHETWQGNMLRYDKSANEIADDIVRIMKNKVLIQDEKPQQSPAQSIMHELKEIRDELVSIQESLHITRDGINEEKKNLKLEERYTEAMKLAGFLLIDPPPGSPVCITFMNMYDAQTIDFDDWEMVGQELEDLKPLREEHVDRFEALIHPKDRVSYYVSNVLKMSNLTEKMYDVTLHNNLESAVKEYISIEGLDGLALGYVVDDEKFELASFDAVSMKHSYDGVNWRQFPKLTQNEISKVKDDLSYLEYALQKENTYHAITEGFTDIAINSALSEMEKNNDLWGTWLGRVANTHRPQDYLDINITGYRYHNRVTCEVLVIHNNEIQDAKEMTIHVDPNNFTESLQEVMHSMLTEFSQFFADSVDLLATDMEYHMQSYHRNGIHTLDEHYEQLKNRGYAFEADRSEYFSTKNKLKKHMTKESDSGEAEEKKESKNVIQQTTRKPKI